MGPPDLWPVICTYARWQLLARHQPACSLQRQLACLIPTQSLPASTSPQAFRLYTEASFQQLPPSTLPEIQRTNLASVVLQV